MTTQLRRRRTHALIAAVVLAATLTACGSDTTDEQTAVDIDAAADDASLSSDDAEVPVLDVAFDELANGRTPDDIAQLLGYYEGGDDPCGDTYGSLHEPTLVQTPGFRDVSAVEVGWNTSLCFGDFDELEVRRPDGSLVPPSPYFGSLLVLPGEPTGTYTATAHSAEGSLTAEVEVVPAEHPHLGVPDTQESPDDAVVYVVGFQGRSSVPIAVYASTSDDVVDPDQLVGLVELPVNELGQGIVEIAYRSNAPSECLTLVADPSQAVQTNSAEEGGVTFLDFGNAYQQSVCSAPPG